MLFLASASGVCAQTNIQPLQDRIETLETELDELKQQLNNVATKSELSSVKSDLDAANEWRRADTLIHMAGYADVGYIDGNNSNGSFNVGSFSPIFHFMYRDLVMLEAEVEMEIEDSGETSTHLEYASVDWFVNDYMVLVSGKFLSPIGQFRQNLHPSWINKLPSAPPGFGHDGAAPDSDTGIQLRGGFPIANIKLNYAFYVSNGPELATVFEGGEYELEGIKAEGFGTDVDGKKVVGGRVAIFPYQKFEIGVSAATGNAAVTSIEDGDSSLLGDEAVRDYDVLGADFNWHFRGFNLRGEYIKSEVGSDVGTGVAASNGAVWKTWYTQGAYLIGGSKWELVARYTDFDSPHNSEDQKQWAIGSNYLFANNFIGKFSYEFNDGQVGTDADQDRVLLQLAYGF